MLRFRLALLSLLALLLSLVASFQIDPALPPARRWQQAAQEYVAARGADAVLADIHAIVRQTLPAALLAELEPLATWYLEEFETTTVAELQGIASALPEVDLHDLVMLNLLIDLADIFPSAERGGIFSVPKTPKISMTFAGEGHEPRQIPFGYVAQSRGSLLRKLATSKTGSSLMSDFLGRASQILSPEEAAPARNESSRCTQTEDKIICSRKEAYLSAGGLLRSVLWEIPLGTAPANGWPVVIMYQGSFFAPHVFSWNGAAWMPFGAYEQTKVIKTLLDNGYAVITPESKFNGYTFWDTNIPPFSLLWDIAPDDAFVKAMITEIANSNGLFGYLNPKMKYATGISSGGYMTSRMAVSYQGEFRSLVVASGSYATCAGPLCVVPRLPKDHPPTLHLHGSLDFIVPPYTMEMYYDAIIDIDVPSEKLIEDRAGHEWITGSAEAVLDWFQRYP